MTLPILTLSETENGLSVCIGAGLGAVELKRGRAEQILVNTFIALRGGVAPETVHKHLSEHQDDGAGVRGCACCLLEGRILSGTGRVRVADTKFGARAPAVGRAEVGVSVGVSGGAIERLMDKAARDRAAKRGNIRVFRSSIGIDKLV